MKQLISPVVLILVAACAGEQRSDSSRVLSADEAIYNLEFPPRASERVLVESPKVYEIEAALAFSHPLERYKMRIHMIAETIESAVLPNKEFVAVLSLKPVSGSPSYAAAAYLAPRVGQVKVSVPVIRDAGLTRHLVAEFDGLAFELSENLDTKEIRLDHASLGRVTILRKESEAVVRTEGKPRSLPVVDLESLNGKRVVARGLLAVLNRDTNFAKTRRHILAMLERYYPDQKEKFEELFNRAGAYMSVDRSPTLDLKELLLPENIRGTWKTVDLQRKYSRLRREMLRIEREYPDAERLMRVRPAK